MSICNTTEGREIVTVGRYGSRTAGKYNVLYTTKVYRAVRRQRDGAVTWRLVSELRAHKTSGKGITGPMRQRARAYAAERGLEFEAGIIYGEVVAG